MILVSFSRHNIFSQQPFGALFRSSNSQKLLREYVNGFQLPRLKRQITAALAWPLYLSFKAWLLGRNIFLLFIHGLDHESWIVCLLIRDPDHGEEIYSQSRWWVMLGSCVILDLSPQLPSTHHQLWIEKENREPQSWRWCCRLSLVLFQFPTSKFFDSLGLYEKDLEVGRELEQEQRGLTSDYKRFPLPSSSTKLSIASPNQQWPSKMKGLERFAALSLTKLKKEEKDEKEMKTQPNKIHSKITAGGHCSYHWRAAKKLLSLGSCKIWRIDFSFFFLLPFLSSFHLDVSRLDGVCNWHLMKRKTSPGSGR